MHPLMLAIHTLAASVPNAVAKPLLSPPCRKRCKGAHGSGERPQCGSSEPAAVPGSGDNRSHAAVVGGALSGWNEEVLSTDDGDDVKRWTLFLTATWMCWVCTHCHHVSNTSLKRLKIRRHWHWWYHSINRQCWEDYFANAIGYNNKPSSYNILYNCVIIV